MRLALTFLLAAACVGLTQPPKLPTLSTKKLSRTTAPTQGSGALSLISPATTIPPIRVHLSPYSITNVQVRLLFTFTTNSPQSNIVFRYYCLKTNQFAPPSTNWPVVAVTTNLSMVFPIDPKAKCVWFTATASNTVTHQ